MPFATNEALEGCLSFRRDGAELWAYACRDTATGKSPVDRRCIAWCDETAPRLADVQILRWSPDLSENATTPIDQKDCLTLIDEPVPARATASLRPGSAPPAEASWLAVLGCAFLKIKHPDLPLPQVQRISEGAGCLMGTEVKLSEALESWPASGTGEPLTVNPERVAEV